MGKSTLVPSEGLFQFFLGQALSIVNIIAEDGTILYQSPSIHKVLGYDSRRRIGANFITSKLVHPDDVAKKQEAYTYVLSHPGTDFKTQMRLQHKNGTWRWAEAVFNNQLQNPDINGIVIITHDITEMKRLEQQKDDFISFASHELKTPLTSIKGLTQILQKRFAVAYDDDDLALLKTMTVQEDRLIRLISDFLDVNKIQTGELTLRKQYFSLDDLILKIIDSFRYVDKSHKIVKHGAAGKAVFADEDRIEQVLSNLLMNAIKYSPGMHKVILSVLQDNAKTFVSVQDFGSGIYKKDIKKIFDRFYRTGENANSRISGFGLGLYITREIIKEHGGEIWVESVKGKGSTFWFQLPHA